MYFLTYGRGNIMVSVLMKDMSVGGMSLTMMILTTRGRMMTTVLVMVEPMMTDWNTCTVA